MSLRAALTTGVVYLRFLVAGSGSVQYRPSGIVVTSSTDFTPAGTGEELAWNIVIPANTLNIDNGAVDLFVAISLAATANTKRIRVYWGATGTTPGTGTAIFDGSTTGNNVATEVRGQIHRSGSTTAEACLKRNASNSTFTALTSLDFTADVRIHVTLTNVTAANDSTFRFGSVTYLPPNL